MLASVVGLYAVSANAGEATYLISDLASLDIDKETGRWLFLGFFIAFAIKAPLFPVHTWLPATTAAATPGTSVLLICVLDKIGTYRSDERRVGKECVSTCRSRGSPTP